MPTQVQGTWKRLWQTTWFRGIPFSIEIPNFEIFWTSKKRQCLWLERGPFCVTQTFAKLLAFEVLSISEYSCSRNQLIESGTVKKVWQVLWMILINNDDGGVFLIERRFGHSQKFIFSKINIFQFSKNRGLGCER